MKIVSVERLIEAGPFAKSEEYNKIEKQVMEAISAVTHPEGTGSFIINPERQGNGVKPIKAKFLEKLHDYEWSIETEVTLPVGRQYGDFDAVYQINLPKKQPSYFVAEWETGNISSSHRALNKMSLALYRCSILGGVLILPTRRLYRYLTDRVGNISELEPYFPLWRAFGSLIPNGVLAVISIEYDDISHDVPLITKGTDGWARYQKTKE